MKKVFLVSMVALFTLAPSNEVFAQNNEEEERLMNAATEAETSCTESVTVWTWTWVGLLYLPVPITYTVPCS